MALGCGLSACGGGGGGGAPAAPASKTTVPAPTQTCASLLGFGTPLPPKCHVNILVGGDSKLWGADKDNTSNEVQAPGAGNGITGRVNTPPYLLMQAKADSTFGPGVATFWGGSIPGSTLPSDLNGTPPSISPLATRLALSTVHYDIVMTNSLTNDQAVLGESPAQYQAYMQTWANTIAGYGAIPLFVEPSPICAQIAGYASYADQVNETNILGHAAETVFQNGGFPYLGNLFTWENSTTPLWTEWMSSDCVHENQPGYIEDVNNYWDGVQTDYGTTNSLKAVIISALQRISL